MVEKGLLGVVAGAVASALLYDPMHKRNIPELARYGVGSVLIVAIVYMLYGEKAALRTLAAASLAGAGVGINRLVMAMRE